MRPFPERITDPGEASAGGRGAFGALFARFVRDERDLPFVRLSALLLAIFVPMAALLLWPATFSWPLALVYLAAYGYFVGPFILMLHNTCHRPLFRAEASALNHVIPWVNGVLLGQSPETYYVHHIGMHHLEENLPADLSCTLAYQRDSFRDFLRYYLAFLTSYAAIARYFRGRGRLRLLRRFFVGEAFFLLLTLTALLWHPRGAVVVFVIPLLFTRFALMSGNWAQHAFVDPEAPRDPFRSVISFVNSPYNRRCFNDGYHLGHHLKASRHWTEMPADFLAHREQLAARGALVFEGTDYFQIFLWLMLGRYRSLAQRVVQLDSRDDRSEDEVVAMLKARVRRFSPEALRTLRHGEPSGGPLTP